MKNVFAVIVCALMFVQCNNDCDKSEIKTDCNYSDEILSTPLENRTAYLNKGNLVPNSSFENSDNEKIISWEVIGKNVKCISNDASEGEHSIKITRRYPSETDIDGEGVVSDFIEVIPGNYNFYYDVKLKNIYPNKERIGTKLFDAINVKVLFFDKNKNRLSDFAYHPGSKVKLDNSFKGYSFSNFWYIDDFGWEPVKARSFNYPFSEGDVPDDCKYVKLAFFLKGRGTMWIDNVDYRFSKWNFSALERMSKHFEKDYSITEMLIPAPKQVSEEVIPIEYKTAIILTASNLSNQEKTAIKLLEKHLIKKDVNVEITNAIDAINPDALVFSVGNTTLLEESKSALPFEAIKEKEQSYFVKSLKEQPNVIFLAGNKPIGSFYAVTTVIQLIDKEKPVYNHVDVIDYPDFLGRSYIFTCMEKESDIEHDEKLVERMSLYKMNKAYVSYGNNQTRKWYAPNDMYKRSMKGHGEKCTKDGTTQFSIMLNPYYHFVFQYNTDTMSEEKKNIWYHSKPNAVKMIKDVLKLSLDAGAKCIMLTADDFVPFTGDRWKYYSLYHEKDEERFVTLANAQAYIINELYAWARKEYGDIRFEFCPPYYLGEFLDLSRGDAERYFVDLVKQIPEDVAIIWTGNTVRSLSVDMADVKRFTDLMGRNPMLWDNTFYSRALERNYGGYPSYYPKLSRLCNIVEPFDIELPKDFHKQNQDRHMYVNGVTFSETYKIKYFTLADYEWNSEAYNPEFSLWKALIRNYGKEASIKILEFNDILFGITAVRREYKDKEIPAEEKLKADKLIKEIEERYEAIKLLVTDNEKLLLKLERLMKVEVMKYNDPKGLRTDDYINLRDI